MSYWRIYSYFSCVISGGIWQDGLLPPCGKTSPDSVYVECRLTNQRYFQKVIPIQTADGITYSTFVFNPCTEQVISELAMGRHLVIWGGRLYYIRNVHGQFVFFFINDDKTISQLQPPQYRLEANIYLCHDAAELIMGSNKIEKYTCSMMIQPIINESSGSSDQSPSILLGIVSTGNVLCFRLNSQLKCFTTSQCFDTEKTMLCLVYLDDLGFVIVRTNGGYSERVLRYRILTKAAELCQKINSQHVNKS